MTSLIKSFAHSLSMVPIALTVHIGVAAATSPVSDRADEQLAWLSGRSATSAPKGAPGPAAARSPGDAQEQARKLLLAIPGETLSASHAYTTRPTRNRAPADPQVQARRVVLGRIAVP